MWIPQQKAFRFQREYKLRPTDYVSTYVTIIKWDRCLRETGSLVSKNIEMRRRLTDLCLEVFALHLTGICSSLTEETDNQEIQAERVTKAKQVAIQIQKTLVSSVPPLFANQVTNMLLTYIDCKCNSGQLNARKCWERDVFCEIAAGFIHPSVTSIKIPTSTFPCHMANDTHKFHTNVIVCVICSKIETLHKLQVLHIGYVVPVLRFHMINMSFPKSLREFCGKCNDKELNVIAKCCPQLMHLQLLDTDSLTDASIDSFQNFKRLETLCFGRTELSRKGFRKLIPRLMEMKSLVYLTFRSFTVFKSSSLVALVNTFPDICIVGYIWDYNFQLLLNLQQLKGLRLVAFSANFRLYFPIFGTELVYLNINFNNENIDLSHIILIGNVCKKLKCLKISAYVCIFSENSSISLPTPGFESLVCLNTDFDSPNILTAAHVKLTHYLISLCLNVKRLFVGLTHFYSKFDLLSKVLAVNPLISLEEIYWKYECVNCNDSDVARLIVKMCPNLKIVSGFSNVLQEKQDEITKTTEKLQLIERDPSHKEQENVWKEADEGSIHAKLILDQQLNHRKRIPNKILMGKNAAVGKVQVTSIQKVIKIELCSARRASDVERTATNVAKVNSCNTNTPLHAIVIQTRKEAEIKPILSESNNGNKRESQLSEFRKQKSDVKMVMHLYNIALDAFANHVRKVFSELIEKDACKEEQVQKSDMAKQISKDMKIILFETLPLPLVDQVTNTVLSSIDMECPAYPLGWQEEIIHDIVGSIIHPAVTRIEAFPNNLCCPHPFSLHGYENMSVISAIGKHLQTLTKLKTLHLKYKYHLNRRDMRNISFPEQLQGFGGQLNFRNLELLAESCKFLKHLNVMDSEDISDSSVDIILKFRHLEELNIAETKISSDGITRLLKGFSCVGDSLVLKTFGCDNVNFDHCNLIAEKLSHLRLFLFNFEGELSLLSKLQHLMGLSVSAISNEFSEHLPLFGRDLVFLNLKYANDDFDAHDLCIIGEICKSLKCLKFSADCEQISEEYDNLLQAPELHSVVCLHSDCECSSDDAENSRRVMMYLLSKCFNVKSLDVNINCCEVSTFFEDLISVNPLEFLEVYSGSYCTSSCVDIIDVAKLLIENCPNLKFLRGYSHERNMYESRGIKFLN
ncbi:hypothetical protein ANN_13298 [Periplaneta americana]|uniref:Uncharacterized protein n=1 Tax=Periplaneta americana TaxID=6978 RepID=A0ABQ8TKF7_PERAM|nr:hypothetical protein ANN_13298 [Periplaneta americana]